MNIVEAFDRVAERQEEFKKEAIDIIGLELRQFLLDHPDIDKLAWHQYTPYFNDGDECIFRVFDLHAHIVSPVDQEEDGEHFHVSANWVDAWHPESQYLSAVTKNDLRELNNLWVKSKDPLYVCVW